MNINFYNMNLKFRTLPVFFAIAIMALFTACEDDDNVAKPVIDLHELGLDNSHMAYIGSDLHIDAEIVAEGGIDKITVEIHAEEGGNDEIEVVYDEFAGLKNTTLHKHIDIPATVAAGSYHFHLVVTDMEGQQTTVEAELSLEELIDEEAPMLTITSSPENGKSFAQGETISISGNLSEDNALAGMVVALVYESDNIADSEVSGDNSKVIVMLHTQKFDSATSHEFMASIEVGAAQDNNLTPAPIEGENAWKSGNYYLLVKAKDAMDNWGISGHQPIVINL